MSESPQEPLIYLGSKQNSSNIINLIQAQNNKSRLLNKSITRSQINERINQQKNNDTEKLRTHLRMKDTFDELYKKINKLSTVSQQGYFKNKNQKRYYLIPNEEIKEPMTAGRKPNNFDHMLQSELSRAGQRSINESQSIFATRRKDSSQSINSPIKIMTVLQNKQSKQQMALKYLKSTAKMRIKNSNEKPSKMSNSIRDYLSVQKIRIKDLESSMIVGHQKRNRHDCKSQSTNMNTSLYDSLTSTVAKELESNLIHRKQQKKQKKQKNSSLKKMQSTKTNTFRTTRLNTKFIVPFETYHYRDLIWRVAYSNEKILQTPQEYQAKIRVFVGKGNNSRLVKSIITRRSWYQITDKVEDATVFWTQIKIGHLFASQNRYKDKHRYDESGKEHKEQTEQTENVYLPSIWTINEQKIFNKYFFSFKQAEERMNQGMGFRNKILSKNIIKKEEQGNQSMYSSQQLSSPRNKGLTSYGSGFLAKQRIQNHFINSYIIGNKKALFQTMSEYYEKVGEDVFDYLPTTFHICNGIQDDKYLKFLNLYYSIAKNPNPDDNGKYNAWIVKPGQNTNRGQGITVCLTLDAIKAILKKKQRLGDGSFRTYIIQKYIERPLLYKKRKFDLRHYIMVNCNNGLVKGYWFKEGYARTTSTQYSLKQGFSSVHLTNDAVQKNLPDYGKHEKGNKISYDDLHNYLLKMGKGLDFYGKAYPRMKKIATDIMKASAHNLDPERRNNFQIYGLDFMLDQNLNVWLIQVNTNPCLQLSCPLLSKIIPRMIENTLQITLDPLYPPPMNFNPKGMTFKQNCLQENGYQLIYDERYEKQVKASSSILNDEKLMKDEDDCFDDDGEDWNQD